MVAKRTGRKPNPEGRVAVSFVTGALGNVPGAPEDVDASKKPRVS